MAVLGYVSALLGSLPSDMKRALIPAFDYVLTNWRLGDGTRAQNAQFFKIETTTSSVASQEFSVAHGLDAIPHWILPILNAHNQGDQFVNLTVTRAADAQRLYLSSPTTNALITIYVETD